MESITSKANLESQNKKSSQEPELREKKISMRRKAMKEEEEIEREVFEVEEDQRVREDLLEMRRKKSKRMKLPSLNLSLNNYFILVDNW